MKRIIHNISLLLCGSILVSGINAQLKVISTTDLLTNINGSTVETSGTINASDIKYEAWVINEGTESVTLKCRRTEIDVLNGTTNATCWNICPPYLNAGDRPVYVANLGNVDLTQTIAPGDTNKTFAGHYTPEGLTGCSLMLFEWFDGDNPTATLASLYIRFIHGVAVCTASIEELNSLKTIIYPNPVQQELTLFIEGESVSFNNYTYEVVNVLGATVHSGAIHNERTTIDAGTLTNGVYFVNIRNAQGTTANTTKFVINR
jgi:hypothetical protein